jgi:hypothetical protein
VILVGVRIRAQLREVEPEPGVVGGDQVADDGRFFGGDRGRLTLPIAFPADLGEEVAVLVGGDLAQ